MNNTTAIAGSNPTISYHRLSKAAGIAFSCAFIVVCFFIVAGNFLTMVLFALSKELRKRSLFLVINMSASDLLRGAVSSLPIFIFMNGDNFRLGKVKTNQYFSFSFIFVEAFLSQVSVISAVSISLERFHAICWPFRQRALSIRAYKICIFITWELAFFVSSIVTLLVWFRAGNSSIYVWMTHALITLLIICGCNIFIWRRSRQRTRIVSLHNRLSIKSLTHTLLFVSFLPLVWWTPLVIMNYLSLVCKLSASAFAHFIAVVLNYCNSCVNPIVYAYRVREFKQASRLCCLDKRVEVERNGKNMAPMFQAYNNQVMETEL